MKGKTQFQKTKIVVNFFVLFFLVFLTKTVSAQYSDIEVSSWDGTYFSDYKFADSSAIPFYKMKYNRPLVLNREYSAADQDLQKYLQENINYYHIMGHIDPWNSAQVTFVVDSTGKVRDIEMKFYRKADDVVKNELVRVINNMPPWQIPGKVDSKPVNVRMEFTIKFGWQALMRKDKRKDFRRKHLGVRLAYINQGTNFGEIGLLAAKKFSESYIGNIYPAAELSADFNFDKTHFIIAPKASVSYVFSIFGARLSLADYISSGQSDIRLTPQIGVGYFDLFMVYYGYNIPLSGVELPSVLRNQLMLSITLHH